MTILYISPLSSEKLVESIHQSSGGDPGYAVQKFNRLMVKGLMANGVSTKILSAIPVSPAKSKKLFWCLNREEENGIRYRYIPFINIKGLRQVCIFLFSFFFVLFWGLTKRKDKAIVCDALSISTCYGALLATRLNGLRSVGILTDMPGMMVFGNGKKHSFATSFNLHCLSTALLEN